ncbi:type 2 lanthipeptide synthetase LanM family protein [Rhizomonospora bruguierae]|uniref:type 2 lanthipeptide synthetase LanM family protein n=1 Tax=Rhizomonospora bruguierae TaxID=1581705 RepID=UPI001BCE437D|nr:type 2 lanthipeptide synthetase LanM family protein [Micromonospora sp. NBRC 107566]
MTVADQTTPGSTSWHRALRLGERATTAPYGARRPTPDLSGFADVLNVPVDGAELPRAAGMFGLGVDDLLRPPVPNDPTEPSWLRDMTAARAYPGPPEPWMVTDGQLGLLRLVGPYVRAFQRQLHNLVADALPAGESRQRLSGLPALLAAQWPAEQLSTALGPTMVLELNVARVRGELAGDTPEARFADFVRRLDMAADEFWVEYPVLLRYLHDVFQGWVESRTAFARHLVQDLPLLDGTFGDDASLGDCQAVEFGAGDRHRGGRSVAIVSFAGGRVVYKPRSLAVDEAWHAVVAWFNGRGPRHDLVTPVVVSPPSTGDRGWAGFIAAGECADRGEAQAHYWRTGALLALLYAVRATDAHTENLIAAGPYPVLVDLETLLHPAPARPAMPWNDPAAAAIAGGVTSIGLLPRKLFVPGERGLAVLDFSAIGVPERQLTPFTVPTPTDAGTDAMRLVDQRAPVAVNGASRLRVAGRLADPRHYQQDVLDGFSWAYQAICADRDAWLGAGGLLDRFATVPVRYISRPTSYYARLLGQSLHPDYLRNAADRDRTFFRLAFGVDPGSLSERLVVSEFADLRAGDIPYFAARPDSRDLWNSRGERIPDALDRPSLAEVTEHVRGLGEPDLAAQTLLIRQAFASLQSGPVSTLAPPVPSPLVNAPLSPAEAHELAAMLARRVCASAVRLGTDIGWITMRLIEDVHWAVDAAPADLYSGVAGIGLFLSTVAALTGDPEIAETALAAAEAVAARAHLVGGEIAREVTRRGTLPPLLRRTADAGVFGMFGGTMYYLTHAGALHHRPDFLDAAEALLPVLRRYVADDPSADLVSGAAGAIVAALVLDRTRPSDEAVDVAVAAGRRLLDTAVAARGGLAWPARFDHSPLTGMAHGAAGVAFALARLDRLVPGLGFAEAVAGALRYERAVRDDTAGTWPDLRDQARGGGGVPLVAWCHGAAGIGLSRFAVLDHPGLSDLHAGAADDLAVAERAVWRNLVSTDADAQPMLVGLGTDAPCHGTLGNLELPLTLARRRGDDEAVRRCLTLAQTVARDGLQRGWRTGVPGVEDIPGLMYGLAGIGYQFLRLVDPGLPSLLLLDPPVGSRG